MVAPWRFLPCETCCEGCVYFTDSFNRANGSDLGADWTEVGGDWSIAGNKLAITADNAAAVCGQLGDDEEVTVLVNLTFGAKGDQLQVLVDYVDPNNYWFAQYEAGDPALNNAIVQIYQRVGGMNNLKATYSAAQIAPTATITAVVCFGATMLNANYSLDGGATISPLVSYPATASTSKCGLGTGICGGTVTFDDFQLSAHYDNNDACTRCRQKCDACEDDKNAERFLLVVAGLPAGACGNHPDTCADLNASYILNPKAFNPCKHELYAYQVPGGLPCLVQVIELRIYQVGVPATHYKCRVTFHRGASPNYIWEKTLVAPNRFDCDAFLNEQIPFLSGGCSTPNVSLTAL